MLYNINNLHTISQDTIEELKKYKNGGDALMLYFEFCKHAKIQKTQNIRASEAFIERGLGWGRERCQNAKKTLKTIGLIAMTKKQNKNGEFFYRIDVFVKINEKSIDGKPVNGTEKGLLAIPIDNNEKNEANTVDGFAVDGKPVDGLYKEEKYLLDNKIIITEKKQKKQIESIEEVKEYINKGKIQDRFFYKVGTEDSFERMIEDFFVHYETNGKKLFSTTCETCFIHFLKPKWETEEDRKNMIIAYRKKFEKKIETEISGKKIEEEDRKKIENHKKIEEIISNMSEEERLNLYNESQNEILSLTKGRKGNDSTFALLVRGRMIKKTAKKEKLELSI